jgi:hypothetical protein
MMNSREHIVALNKILSHLARVPHLPLKYPKLDLDSLRLRVCADASFGSNADGSSQLGYCIFLADKHGKCQLLTWSSHKSKRVTRSVAGAETMALADAFDSAYSLKHDLQAMLCREVPITVYTDSLSLFDVRTKSTVPREKRLMIDVVAIKNAYKSCELDTIAFIRTQHNPEDVLTKIMKSDVLSNVIKNSEPSHPVEQRIVRP